MKQSAKTTYIYVIVGLLLVGTIGFGILCAGWYFVLSASADNNRMITKTNNLYKESAKLGEISYSLKKVSSYKQLLFESIPQAKDISTFNADMEKMAITYGIDIKSVRVGDGQQKTNKGGDFSQAVSKQDYYEIPVTYTTESHYGDFVNFITNLNNIRRLNKVTDVTAIAANDPVMSPDWIRGGFKMTIYTKK